MEDIKKDQIFRAMQAISGFTEEIEQNSDLVRETLAEDPEPPGGPPNIGVQFSGGEGLFMNILDNGCHRAGRVMMALGKPKVTRAEAPVEGEE